MPPGTAYSAALQQPARPGVAGRSGGSPTDQSASFWRRHRRAIATAVSFLFAIGFFYVVVPRLVGLGPTLRLLRRGDVWWLALGVVLEALSYVGAIVLFRGVFTRS